MKKTYIHPAIQVIRVQTSSMIALSQRSLNNVDATKNSNGDYNDSRSGSVWDDDED
jgi:hypothetical protein